MCLTSNPNEENNKLDALMKFLRQEIESEEKVLLARSGFNLELDNINKCTSASSKRERTPTAAELYNSSENKKESCIFCGKLHFSNHCRYAHNLSDNTKRIEWPLAKVIELYPSKDGSIRLVKVKMKSGEFLRLVLRLIPLEVTQKVDLGKPLVDRIFPTNEPTVQPTGRECSSETIPDDPDVQRTVNDFSSETS
ncbi:hypothetical protein TNIN_480971 [Trichonephila inaurata madagascariensis]|uniref:DUF5641 domain-containing protein n=1 Tax=Trichonephila inaurata madagascariensis TaxID=2747483 RepID=A0A8X6X5J5_9ARAC|nr:hypothetical protein TNIN_480971 [Trichonephila inaurata madagascariensis]